MFAGIITVFRLGIARIRRTKQERCMPLFDFLCADCGHVEEVLVFSEEMTVFCKMCGRWKHEKVDVRAFVFVRNSLYRHARPRRYGLLRIFPGPCRMRWTWELLRKSLKIKLLLPLWRHNCIQLPPSGPNFIIKGKSFVGVGLKVL
jgi:putative FmdB family regulatory protein